MRKRSSKRLLKDTWHFIWEDDSVWSWIVNIILAFILIKFLVYPGLGLVFQTTHPIVAVVSESMEHKSTPICIERGRDNYCLKYSNTDFKICGNILKLKKSYDFDEYWDICGEWYAENQISKSQFQDFPLKNGFNTGDIMILYGEKPKNINVGEVIVFKSSRPDPIIHRVVKTWYENGEYYFETKGDHNPKPIDDSVLSEVKISENQLIGKAILKIPYLGWVKILFVKLLQLIGIT